MSTKYGDRIAEDKWAVDREEGADPTTPAHQPEADRRRPHVTTHARQRWDERLDGDRPAIERVLRDAVPVHAGLCDPFHTDGYSGSLCDVLLGRVRAGATDRDVVFYVSDESHPRAVTTVYVLGMQFDRDLRAYARTRLDLYYGAPTEVRHE